MSKTGLMGALAVVALAGATQAQMTLYDSNGFEGPTFVPGPIAGQQGYFFQGAGTGIIQSVTVQAGTQAAEVTPDNTPPSPGGTWFWTETPFVMGTAGNSVLEVSWDMLVTQPGPLPGAFGIDMYQSNPFDRIVGVFVDDGPNGHQIYYIFGGAAAAVNTGQSVPLNTWNRFVIILDFAQAKMDLKLNGNTIVSGVAAPNLTPTTTYTDSDLWALGGGGDNKAYYDNLKVIVRPATAPCYPDCNGDGVLNLADFGCFQTRFATGNMYADCNGDGVLNLADFGCFQTKFALGC